MNSQAVDVLLAMNADVAFLLEVGSGALDRLASTGGNVSVSPQEPWERGLGTATIAGTWWCNCLIKWKCSGSGRSCPPSPRRELTGGSRRDRREQRRHHRRRPGHPMHRRGAHHCGIQPVVAHFVGSGDGADRANLGVSGSAVRFQGSRGNRGGAFGPFRGLVGLYLRSLPPIPSRTPKAADSARSGGSWGTAPAAVGASRATACSRSAARVGPRRVGRCAAAGLSRWAGATQWAGVGPGVGCRCIGPGWSGQRAVR